MRLWRDARATAIGLGGHIPLLLTLAELSQRYWPWQNLATTIELGGIGALLLVLVERASCPLRLR